MDFSIPSNETELKAALEAAAGLAEQYGLQLTITDCSQQAAGYNQGLAIASIFVIFVMSFVGFMTPVYCSARSHLAFTVLVATLAFVGTAILLTVGFIHILGDAVVDLASPCLTSGFREAYPSWALLICVVTIIILMVLDWVAEGHIERAAADAAGTAPMPTFVAPSTKSVSTSGEDGGSGDGDVGSEGDSIGGYGSGQLAALESGAFSIDRKPTLGRTSDKVLASLHAKRAVVAIVEITVCTHSIPVGLDLGLQPASNFVGLLIAIIFHQMLEGLGVGAAVADAQFSQRTSIFLAFMFAATCPIGIGVGIALHGSLNPKSPTYLLLLGVVNAVAAGMLIYTAFEHMNAFTSRGSWLRQQGWHVQALCLLAFLAAAAGMLLVGKWA